MFRPMRRRWRLLERSSSSAALQLRQRHLRRRAAAGVSTLARALLARALWAASAENASRASSRATAQSTVRRKSRTTELPAALRAIALVITTVETQQAGQLCDGEEAMIGAIDLGSGKRWMLASVPFYSNGKI